MQATETALLPAPDPGSSAARPEHQQIGQNIKAVLDFYAREEERITKSHWLQGISGLGALMSAIVGLSSQSRLAKLAEHRADLDLKVTLMTEQKTAKLIDLLEELRRDLPDVINRHDPEAAVLQQSMNPDQVLATLDEETAPAERLKLGGEDEDDSGKPGTP